MSSSWSTLSCVLLVLAILLGAALAESLPAAVYLLSFWHYGLYWLAFAFGASDFDVFKHNAIALKTLSVTALAVVYLGAPIDPVSLAVILGLDRTYYGHEVAGLPGRRITTFPYSLTSHPMILGNVAAFGGTLTNASFRADWWPLASLHAALNIGLLAMELAGPRHRGAVRIGGGFVLVGALLGAVFAIARGTP